jgi:hypothetical protein
MVQKCTHARRQVTRCAHTLCYTHIVRGKLMAKLGGDNVMRGMSLKRCRPNNDDEDEDDDVMILLEWLAMISY